MRISLKPGERIFINGAVLRVDRKVTIELMNDVTFLLESHVMQAEEATTPLRQLYFIVQSMLIEPANFEASKVFFERTLELNLKAFENEDILASLKAVGELVSAGKAFEALKTIRGLYRVEEKILVSGKKSAPDEDKNARLQDGRIISDVNSSAGRRDAKPSERQKDHARL